MWRRGVAPSHLLGVDLGQRMLKTRSEFKLLWTNVTSTNLRKLSIEILVGKSEWERSVIEYGRYLTLVCRIARESLGRKCSDDVLDRLILSN